MSKANPLPSSFHHAVNGIKEAIKKEPSFRIHLALASICLILALVLKLDQFKWLILLFTIFFVLILELINTSLEAITDLVSPQIHPRAKIAKDVSAAAVLLGAILALIIAVFVFTPKLLSFLK